MPKGQKGINKMKKNIFKKIVASLATVAMAAGLFTAMPVEEAKADERVAVDELDRLHQIFVKTLEQLF